VSLFTATQATRARGDVVRFARLVHFSFVEQEMRLWEGFHHLTAGGQTWLGGGYIGTVGPIPFGANDAAGVVQFTLSGVTPEIVAMVRRSASVRGRPVTVYGQFLDAEYQPLDAMIVLAKLVMDMMSYAATGPVSRRIQLTAETIWTSRNMSPFAVYSDRDQQGRYPGDLGCEFVASLANKVIAWPIF
jgi:hypothetical protein